MRGLMRKLVGSTAAVLTASFIWASAVSANVYCVPHEVVDPSCTSGQGKATIQAAFSAAATNAGADSVRIGPGTYPENAAYSSALAGNTVTVVGAGESLTNIDMSTTGSTIGLRVQGPAGSSASDLSVTIPANVDAGDTGLMLGGETAGTRLRVEGPAANNVAGVQIFGTATLDDSTVDLPVGASNGSTAIRQSNAGTPTVTDSTLKARTGGTTSGLGNVLTIERSRITAEVGTSNDSGTVAVRDSIIDLGSLASARGIQAANFNNGVNPITANVDGVTIVGGGASSRGISAVADSGLPANGPGDMVDDGENSTVNVANTVISGPTNPIGVEADRGQTAVVNTDYSNYNAAFNFFDTDISNGGAFGNVSVNPMNQTNLAPDFVNPGAGDYHLQATSPLVDIGDPAAPAPARADIDGDQRAASAAAVACPPAAATRDIGADEVTFDCVAPETSITDGPFGATNTTTPTFEFESTGGTSFECSVDGAAFGPCSGLSSHTTAALSVGPDHSFAVRASDANGNVDQTPAQRDFVIDQTVPDTMITGGPTGLTNESTPTFSFTSEPGSTFQCRLDDSDPFAACSGPGNTHTPPSGLADGTQTFEVIAIDAAGNVETLAASQVFTVDQTPPVTTITPIGLTNDSTPIFGFSQEAGSTVQCGFDGGPLGACSGPGSTHTPPLALSDGPHTFEVQATDQAGNAEVSPASEDFTVDTALPVTMITGPSGQTNDSTPTFGFSSELGSTFQCRIDGGAFGACSGPGDAHTPAVALTDGLHTFEVKATDAAGNLELTPASRSFTVNTSVPPPPVVIPPPGDDDDDDAGAQKKKCKKGQKLKKVKGKRKCVRKKALKK